MREYDRRIWPDLSLLKPLARPWAASCSRGWCRFRQLCGRQRSGVGVRKGWEFEGWPPLAPDRSTTYAGVVGVVGAAEVVDGAGLDAVICVAAIAASGLPPLDASIIGNRSFMPPSFFLLKSATTCVMTCCK